MYRKGWVPPLHTTIFVKNFEGAQLLIEAGADVNLLFDDGYGSYTPLHQVIIGINQIDQVELRQFYNLLAAGADPNIRDKNDMSALDWAKRNIDKGDPFKFLNSKGLKVLKIQIWRMKCTRKMQTLTKAKRYVKTSAIMTPGWSRVKQYYL